MMPPRKRSLSILSLMALAVLMLLTGTLLHRYREPSPASPQHPPEASPSPPMVGKPEKPLTGEIILQHYADPDRPAEEDLVAMAHVLDNFALLVKGDTPLPLGANEDIAHALRGKNRLRMRFLPDDHRALNPKGQLIDRWGTPLFFHANDRTRLDIRSAGPDQTMWTADDLHRRHDGRFLRDETLSSPSLFEATATPKP